ncbi:MAG: hypothetical protein ISP71_08390 [Flavobacteriales bacterium]|nr:hypothetical protein [Flavobacteriales bacterium]
MGYLVKVKNHSTDARLCATYVVHAKEWVKYKMPEGFKDSKAFRGYEERLKRGLFIKEDINIARLSNDADFNLTSKRTKKGDVHKSKEKIESKNHKFSKMDRGCRFHNVFTNCVKKYRKDMEHKGKKVKEIDIRCCFPLLMTCLYGDKRYSKGSMFDKVINRADERREFRRYVDFLDSKPFYKTIGISKKTFGIALFSEMSGIKWERNKLISYLKKHFPLLYYRIKRFRAATSGKALALLLQRWESHIMIENVLTKADFGAIPVHDGILVSEENERKALDLIKEAFRKCLQIKHLTVRIGNKTKKLVSQGS